MKRGQLVGFGTALLLTVVSVSWAASNLNLSKGNIDRVQSAAIVTATASLSRANETQVVFTAPLATGDFILTQLCVSPVKGGIRLAAENLGPLAHTGAELCTTFHPGMSVPPDSDVTCSTTAEAVPGSYFCTISGLLTQ